jgi:hypothetical protein
MSSAHKVAALRDLAPHQEAALRTLHNGSILWGGVGTGKSRVAMEYYVRNEAPAPIYVITTARKRDSLDWIAEAANRSITTPTITVDSWNNLSKYVDVEKAFFIFDEQRLVGKGEWVKAFLKIVKHNRWIMLTATPGDTWMDYIPVFIANKFYKNRTEFIREHVVYKPYVKFPAVDHYVGLNKLVRQRLAILTHMPYAKQTRRHSKTERVEYDVDLLEQVIKNRWHPFEERPLRDKAELFIVGRRIVNSDPSRAAVIRRLLREFPKLIVFYNFDFELEILRGVGARGEGEVAEWNGHRHQEIPKTDQWLYIVQYVAGAEAWNCIETNAMAFYSMTYSYKMWEQAHGRIDRMNSPFLDLYYYTLRSNSVIDRVIWGALKQKKSFNVHTFDEKILGW